MPIKQELVDKYFYHKKYKVLLTISPNNDIRTIPIGEYYISDWRDYDNGWSRRDTVFGFFGEELMSYLEKHKYKEITDTDEIAYYLLMKAGEDG